MSYRGPDPTADEFIQAMTVLRQYTLDSQISVEGDHLVAIVMNGMEVVSDDEEKLAKLGWKLTRRDGKASHFAREFCDH